MTSLCFSEVNGRSFSPHSWRWNMFFYFPLLVSFTTNHYLPLAFTLHSTSSSLLASELPSIKKPDIEYYHQQDGLLSLTKVEPGKNKGSSPSPVFRWFLKWSIYVVFVNAFTSTMNWGGGGMVWCQMVDQGYHTHLALALALGICMIYRGALQSIADYVTVLSWWFLESKHSMWHSAVTSSPYLFAVCRRLYYPFVKGLQ